MSEPDVASLQQRQRGWVLWLLDPAGQPCPDPPGGLGAGWSTALRLAARLDVANARGPSTEAWQRDTVERLRQAYQVAPPGTHREGGSLGPGAPESPAQAPAPQRRAWRRREPREWLRLAVIVLAWAFTIYLVLVFAAALAVQVLV